MTTTIPVAAPLRRQRSDAGVESLQECLVEALAVVTEAAARWRPDEVARRCADDAVANALAPGLVVDPQHGKAGRLQHVQQVLLLAGALGKSFPAERREHAGHRGVGVGTARPDVAVAQHAECSEFGRGVACITVEREVIGPRGFADDEDQQRRFHRWGMAAPERRAAADRGEGRRSPGERLERHLRSREDRRHRIRQVAQLHVVSHQGRECTVAGRRRSQGQRQRSAQELQPAQRSAPKAGTLDSQRDQPESRQARDHHDMAEEGPGQEIGRLVSIRLGDVRQHRGIDQDAVVQHVVLTDGCGEQHGEPHRLHPAAPRGQRQQGGRDGRRDHTEDEHVDRTTSTWIDAGKGVPERDVRNDRQPDRKNRHDAVRRTRRRPGGTEGAERPHREAEGPRKAVLPVGRRRRLQARHPPTVATAA